MKALIESVLERAGDCAAGYPRSMALQMFLEDSRNLTVATPHAQHWLPDDWDARHIDARRCHVVDVLYPMHSRIGCGSRLRTLRSPRLESWLARNDEASYR